MLVRTGLVAAVVIWLAGQRGPVESDASIGPIRFGVATSWRQLTVAVFPSVSSQTATGMAHYMRFSKPPLIEIPGVILWVAPWNIVSETGHAITIIPLAFATVATLRFPNLAQKQPSDCDTGSETDNEA